MKVGEKFRFFIPYKLAYGEDGRPDVGFRVARFAE